MEQIIIIIGIDFQYISVKRCNCGDNGKNKRTTFVD